MIQKDKEGYKDPGHSLEKFDKFKRHVEKTRLKTQETNERQVGVYDSMLLHLQNQHQQPSDVEQFILNVTRVMLEEGWAITETDFYIIMDSIDFEE